jgi:predicted hydrocarbon binding protein
MKLPRTYVGKGHETIGSDILAVVRALERLGTAESATRLFGAEWAARLLAVDPEGWYPIAMLLEALDRVLQRVGENGVRRAGRELFRLSHESRVAPTSARDIVYGIDTMYKHANRGIGIGGWEVVVFEPGRAELVKTTPHLCLLEEGILAEGLSVAGARSLVTQSDCIRRGADACRFVITSSVTDHRWQP